MHTFISIGILVNINFNPLNWSVFITDIAVVTKPQLNIISSWCGELLAEPGRIVELTASISTLTSLTVPEWIVRIENGLPSLSCFRVTEVILADEWRYF